MSLKIVCVAQNLYKILYIKFFYHHHAGDNHYVLQQNSEKTNIYLLNVLLRTLVLQYNNITAFTGLDIPVNVEDN